jgi:hypothetical protein
MLRRYISEIIKLLKNYFDRTSFDIAIDKTDNLYWGIWNKRFQGIA